MTILKYGLLILLMPVLLGVSTGCNGESFVSDKWPDILTWSHTQNFDVTVELIKPFGIPRLEVPDRTVDVTCQVRSYHALQEYTVRVFLTGISESVTFYTDNLPAGGFDVNLPIAETFVRDGVFGTYVPESGKPPQGTAELTFFFEPDYFPLSVNDWIRFEINEETGDLMLVSVSDRFVYHYRVVIEDKGGRTDSFEFDVISNLKVQDSNNSNN